jgi:hypothetical protein
VGYLPWTPFIDAKKHTISAVDLVCIDQRGTMRRAEFRDERWYEVGGGEIHNVIGYKNSATICKALMLLSQKASAG